MDIIQVNKLGKRYKRYSSHWARLGEWISGGLYDSHEELWALREISFNIRSGESLGIIGQNGAGKSTLLKILTGTTQPTEGSMSTTGRISALLELGMGFHPDFTGKENAELACQMIGIGKEESKTLLAKIADFSELGDYLDQPLRVYSTGMQMRLAFSTATAVRPDVLIVDEALAVGDAYFQHKCIQRIRSFKERGTTLLFVSHDPAAVKTLCDRAILIEQGILIQDGTPEEVLDYYNAMIAQKSKEEEIEQTQDDSGRSSTRSGSGKARIVKVDVLDQSGRATGLFQIGETVKIVCKCEFLADVVEPTIGILVRDRLGNDVFGTNTYNLTNEFLSGNSGERITATFAVELHLGLGNYALSVALHAGKSHLEDNWDWWDNCAVFQIIPGHTTPFVGLAALPVKVDIQKENIHD